MPDNYVHFMNRGHIQCVCRQTTVETREASGLII